MWPRLRFILKNERSFHDLDSIKKWENRERRLAKVWRGTNSLYKDCAELRIAFWGIMSITGNTRFTMHTSRSTAYGLFLICISWYKDDAFIETLFLKVFFQGFLNFQKTLAMLAIINSFTSRIFRLYIRGFRKLLTTTRFSNKMVMQPSLMIENQELII